MQALIDWYSFTLPLPTTPGKSGDVTKEFILNKFHLFTSGIAAFAFASLQWKAVRGNGFYTTRYFVDGMGISFSFGDVNAHALFEFTGTGCEFLRSMGVFYDIVQLTADRTTRLDFAVDIETNVTPKEFVELFDSERFKTRSSLTSPTGDTEYIGSRKGERMARVYRYNDPHPRSHLLRVECEYKGDLARAFSAHLVEAALSSVTLSAHEPFQWKHPVWKPFDVEAATIEYKRMDVEAAQRIRWLLGAVVPSVVDSDRGGIFSWASFQKAVHEKMGRDFFEYDPTAD